ncbi:MAG TPA: SBBP repeat-containing protein [Blastocatellia bacterium]|nr:SBBP repeat-containing protein [Blastocatellia bacterium]
MSLARFLCTAALLMMLVVAGLSPVRSATVERFNHPPSTPAEHRASTLAAWPLGFEANCGQAQSDVKFLSRGAGCSFGFTPSEIILAFANAEPSGATVLRMRCAGANRDIMPEGVAPRAGKMNYLIGSDPARWQTGVSTFAGVQYQAVYPGTDLVFYGNQRQLEYDFRLAPGADPRAIRLTFEGTRDVRLSAQGDLLLQTASGELRQPPPFAYQQAGGIKQAVACRYLINERREVTFQLGEYDARRPLVIDPVLAYASFVGAQSSAIAVDAAGNVYLAGVAGPNFVTTPGAAQAAFASGFGDAFVMKLDRKGGDLIYATYVGGAGYDVVRGVAVDASGGVYITGYTSSLDFPTTPGAFSTAARTPLGVAFVARLDASGARLSYSTYLGGSSSEVGVAIALSAGGEAYVFGVTASADFPVTPQAFQKTRRGGLNPQSDIDGFVARVSADGSRLIYATYLGGSDLEQGLGGIAVDHAGQAYVTGMTRSADFPVTQGALQPAKSVGTCEPETEGAAFPCEDLFVTKLSADGSSLIYSTYLGGKASEHAGGIAVDADGNAYVVGTTESEDFPVTKNAFQRKYQGGSDALVAKLSEDGQTLKYATYVGGEDFDGGNAIAVDGAGNAYITGGTGSVRFPTTSDNLQATTDDFDPFITVLNGKGSAAIFSTYLGGHHYDNGAAMALDAVGSIYVTGITLSGDFPVTRGALRTAFGGENGQDAFVFKVRFGPEITSAAVNGKKLIVSGEGFQSGAVILLNGEERATHNDDANPNTRLISKRAGKRIAPGGTVVLQVKNPDGTKSLEWLFQRPPQ